MLRLIENRLIAEFEERDTFSREELLNFFKKFEPNLNEGTFGWRVHDLSQKSIIRPVQRGFYSISFKPKYQPEISVELLKLAKVITNKFETVKYCLWDTNWLNEFSKHQAGKKIIVIEIERDFVESLYYELKDTFRFNFFLNPDEKAMEFYVSESPNPVIIKRLVTRSPIVKRTAKGIEFYVPSLEKVLVDLFAEKQLFYFYQGSELIHVYDYALKKYTLNYTKLLSYAKRREKEKTIKAFLTDHFQYGKMILV